MLVRSHILEHAAHALFSTSRPQAHDQYQIPAHAIPHCIVRTILLHSSCSGLHSTNTANHSIRPERHTKLTTTAAMHMLRMTHQQQQKTFQALPPVTPSQCCCGSSTLIPPHSHRPLRRHRWHLIPYHQTLPHPHPHPSSQTRTCSSRSWYPAIPLDRPHCLPLPPTPLHSERLTQGRRGRQIGCLRGRRTRPRRSRHVHVLSSPSRTYVRSMMVAAAATPLGSRPALG